MRSRRLLLVFGAALAGVLLAASAAYGYDRHTARLLLPETSIGGVAVGGMSLSDAETRLKAKLLDPLYAPIRVAGPDGKTTTTTPWSLGLRLSVKPAVREAWKAGRDGNLLQRVWWRMTGAPAETSVSLQPRLDRKLLDAYLAEVRSDVFREAVSPKLDTSSGWVSIRGGRLGRELDTEHAKKALLAAARNRGGEVQLRTRNVQPKVGVAAYQTVVLVRAGENKLYLYKGGEIAKTYNVAVGAPGFETPTGTFKIIRKRLNPRWINPGSDWAKKMPDSIPPGPDNPLGSRAMDLNTSGIRIHGTPNAASIGFNTSHGCVRMTMSDAEDLFEHVEVDTPVVIINVAPPRLPGAKPVATPAPAPVAA